METTVCGQRLEMDLHGALLWALKLQLTPFVEHVSPHLCLLCTRKHSKHGCIHTCLTQRRSCAKCSLSRPYIILATMVWLQVPLEMRVQSATLRPVLWVGPSSHSRDMSTRSQTHSFPGTSRLLSSLTILCTRHTRPAPPSRYHRETCPSCCFLRTTSAPKGQDMSDTSSNCPSIILQVKK